MVKIKKITVQVIDYKTMFSTKNCLFLFIYVDMRKLLNVFVVVATL